MRFRLLVNFSFFFFNWFFFFFFQYRIWRHYYYAIKLIREKKKIIVEKDFFFLYLFELKKNLKFFYLQKYDFLYNLVFFNIRLFSFFTPFFGRRRFYRGFDRRIFKSKNKEWMLFVQQYFYLRNFYIQTKINMWYNFTLKPLKLLLIRRKLWFKVWQTSLLFFFFWTNFFFFSIKYAKYLYFSKSFFFFFFFKNIIYKNKFLLHNNLFLVMNGLNGFKLFKKINIVYRVSFFFIKTSNYFTNHLYFLNLFILVFFFSIFFYFYFYFYFILFIFKCLRFFFQQYFWEFIYYQKQQNIFLSNLNYLISFDILPKNCTLISIKLFFFHI